MFKHLELRYSEGDLARTLVESALKKVSELTKVDVVVVGAGPAGLTAAWNLAEQGFKTVVLERMLGVGGGIRGGGMLLPCALIEKEALEILSKANVKVEKVNEDVYVIDPTETMVKIASKAIDSGAIIWPGVQVEDLIVKDGDGKLKVRGVVINWTAIHEANWHVDPLMLESKAVLDATGHDASVLRILAIRCPYLNIKIPGMSAMNVWKGESLVVELTGEVVDGLYVAGMSVAEFHNINRMGPVLGGMLLSGLKAARMISEKLSG